MASPLLSSLLSALRVVYAPGTAPSQRAETTQRLEQWRDSSADLEFAVATLRAPNAPPDCAPHEWLQLECEIPRLSAAVDAVVDFSASSLLSHPGLWMAAYRRPLRSLSAPCVRPRKAG